MPTRRDFLTTLGACTAGVAVWPERPIAGAEQAGFRGVQLHANAIARRVDLPGAFGALGEVGYSG